MKKKLLVLAAVILLLAVTPVAYNVVRQNALYRYHQHLEVPAPKAPCPKADGELCTHLPVVSILAKQMPVNSRGSQGRTGLVNAPCQVFFYDSGQYNHPGDTPAAQSLGEFHIRGNSSRSFDKQSYKLNLKTAAGDENKALSVFGMPAFDEWVLNGPFMDRSLLRNYLCYNISGEIRGDTPEVRFCELLINGEYQGLYLAAESVAVSVNRVNLSKFEEGDRVFSYMVQSDRAKQTNGLLEDFLHYGFFRVNQNIRHIEYPSPDRLTPQQERFIETDLSRIEKALYSYDYSHPVYGYKATLDAASFVDYYIINEFFGNYDAGLFSTYYYKDRRGKLTIGPVWDFNNALGNYAENSGGDENYMLHSREMYYMLFRDDDFVERVISRYKWLRLDVLAEDYLTGYIDEAAAYLGGAVGRNYALWGKQFDLEEMDTDAALVPKERNPESYSQAITDLKQYVLTHGRWLDENIDNLRQFSHPSQNKKYKH